LSSVMLASDRLHNRDGSRIFRRCLDHHGYDLYGST